MKKIYLWLVFLIIGISMFLTGFVINASDITNGESIKSQYKLGMIPVEKTTYYSLGIAKNAQLTQELPEKVDFTDKFPLPGDQGRQGSCVGWATAYALKSYLEKVDFDWDQNLLEHKFSPAYVYNQINGGRDKGAQIPDALNLIVKQGVCSLAVMPYSDQNYKTQPNSTQKAEAAKFKSASWSVVKDDVNEIKAQLAAGNAVVLGIPVYDDFFDLTASNDVYDNTEGELAGYHAICLVGYDDSKQAFKLINSWGTEQWGLNGYGYIAYDLITKEEIEAYVMQDIKHNVNPSPTPTVSPTPTPTPTPTPSPTPSNTNLALNKTVTASAYYNNDLQYAPKNAVDGSLTTRWAVEAGFLRSQQWLKVDLGSQYSINSVKIRWSETNYSKKYTISSWNGTSWVAVKTITGDGSLDEIQFDTPFVSQYIKVDCSNSSNGSYVVYELEVYGN